MKVVVLGSGTPVPVAGRAGSAVAVVDAAGAWVLIDCGRAATQRAIDAGLDLSRLVAVAITHHHSDHLGDLATLATVRWTAGASTPLRVIAPVGPSADFATRCLDVYDDSSFYAQAHEPATIRPTVDVESFAPSDTATVECEAGPWILSSALVDHHPIEPAVGYRVEHTGRRVAVSGDTVACDGVRSLATGADVLVHEALLSSVPGSLLEWNASAASVGALAAEVEPGTLVLTHLIPAPHNEQDEQAFVAEIRTGGFGGPVVVARDLQVVDVSG